MSATSQYCIPVRCNSTNYMVDEKLTMCRLGGLCLSMEGHFDDFNDVHRMHM